MALAVALAYVVALAALGASMATRTDPRLGMRLGGDRGGRRRPRLDRLGSLVATRLPGARGSSARLLAAAGLDPGLADRVVAAKALLSALGIGLGLLGGPMGVLAVPVLGVAGFRLPDFVLARSGRARRGRTEAFTPHFLDLVSVCVTAGLSPRLAIDRAANNVHGSLGDELQAMRSEVALGTPWPDALRGVAQRTGALDLDRLVRTVDRTRRLGSPLADGLLGLASEVRAERRLAEEERARRAPVVMLLPLVFLILPAFVLAAVVPAVLVAVRGMS